MYNTRTYTVAPLTNLIGPDPKWPWPRGYKTFFHAQLN